MVIACLLTVMSARSAVADILEHHGVLGMKWGIRKDRGKSNGGSVTVNVPHFGTGQLVTKQVTAKKAAKLDKKWEKEVASTAAHASVYDAGAAHFNQRIGAINDKFAKAHPKEFSDGTLWNESHPVTQAYHKEAVQALKEGLNNSVKEFGPNPTGTKRVKLVTENEHSVTEFGWQLKTEKIKHAATNEEVVVFVAKQNAKGIITSIAPLTDPASQFSNVNAMAQTTELGKEFVAHQSVLDNPDLAAQIKAKLQSILDDVTGDADKDLNLFGDPIIRVKLQSVLQDFYKDPNVTEAMVYSALGELAMEHHGIKGMHWGIRRDHPSGGPQAVHPSATSRVPAGDRRKTKIKTEGGQNIDAHPDAIKVAESKAKLKKSGVSALSNQELRDVSQRIRLESEAQLLTSRKGSQFVKRHLKRGIKKAGLLELQQHFRERRWPWGQNQTLGRIVIYRSRTGDYDVPAIITATMENTQSQRRRVRSRSCFVRRNACSFNSVHAR
jgi:hypothetical protein